MKKLTLGLLVSFLLYLLIYGFFIKKSKDEQQSFEENYGAYDAHKAQVLNTAARQEAFEFSSNSTLTLKNDTQSDVLIKVIKASDDSDYMIYLLQSDSRQETDLVPGRYYLKMRYYEGKKFAFQRGDEFSINEGSQTIISLKKVILGNYGTSSLSPSEF
jgi:hypothetical protein